jgi:hypothetical protein
MINVGLFKNEQYNIDYSTCEDYELWCRLVNSHKLSNLNKPLILYRSHPTNISNTSQEEHWFQLYNKVVRDKLKVYFNYESSEEELFIHGAWLFHSYKEDYKYLKNSNRWLRKLQKINGEQKVFEEKLFNKVLKRNWFDRCWHNINKGNVLTAFYFLFFSINFSLRDIFIFLYLFMKTIYNIFTKSLDIQIVRYFNKNEKNHPLYN